ncbi:IclR family transcriptional regulator [Phycicoccus elongatus]|uniref:IclR family transcriptional regulator n=1 Tax=Phycicoccus elongatus TaxID=101689 RepID=UPI0037850F77
MSLVAVTGDEASALPPPPSSRHADPGRETLRSVATALDVLECFAVDDELGVSDIARRLGIAKSTAHRLLATLCSRGLTEKNCDSGQYRLGLHLYELGQLAQSRLRLRQTALPVLEDVRRVSGLTVQLGVVDGADIVYAERLETAAGRALMAGVARRWPSHCTASGKVIAAFNPELAQARRDLGFPPRTLVTIRSVADYDRALAETRRVGVGISRGEAVAGLSSVAAPVRDLTGIAYASVSVVGPSAAVHADLDRSSRLVRTAAGLITHRLSA